MTQSIHEPISNSANKTKFFAQIMELLEKMAAFQFGFRKNFSTIILIKFFL